MARGIELNRCLVLWSGLLLLGLALPAQAHNGAVAIAVPVAGITVDGDLSDWPEGMRRYPIALPEYGDRSQDEQDFQGAFRVGYNAQENALYVAVEVQDESGVIDTTSAADWDTQDGCDVYLDLTHREENPAIAQYVMWGNTKKVYGGEALADVEVKVQKKERAQHYEWRIEVGRMSKEQGKQRKVQAYQVLGVKAIPERGRGVSEGYGPLVGRQEELAQLRALVETVPQGQGRVLGVVGEAGIGKSRLVYELQELAASFTQASGACVSYEVPASYQVFTEVLRHLLSIAADDPTASGIH